MSRVQSTFASDTDASVTVGVGVVKRPKGGKLAKDEAGAWMSYWEPEMAPNGSIACAVIIPGGQTAGFAETGDEFLLIGRVQPGKPFVHYLGAGWSKSGDFPDAAAWESYVRDYARRLATPVVVK